MTRFLYIMRGDIYSDMECPKCSTEMMLKQKYETSIDYCPSCGGVWLDRGEIDKLIQSKLATKTNIIKNTIIETVTMMTIIIIIDMEGEDFLVTCFTKTSARIR